MSRRYPRPTYDVLALGCAAVDEILYVPAYPPADAKVEVRLRERHCGGLCATALVAAARMGARCAFAGTLGYDEGSAFVLETLGREGVDLRHVIRRRQAGPVRSTIIVDEKRRTRNVFFDPKQSLGADPRKPAREVILNTRVLFVDRFGIPGMIRAARLARAAGIPVVADFETSQLPRFRELLSLVDHLILSSAFACRLAGCRSAAAAAARFSRAGHRVVVITSGAEGCFYIQQPDRQVRHLPAFPVRAVDTTGCGDVFHGVYAAALARGLPLLEGLQMASAAAAIKARTHGGQEGIARLTQVRAFLKAQPTAQPARKPA